MAQEEPYDSNESSSGVEREAAGCVESESKAIRLQIH